MKEDGYDISSNSSDYVFDYYKEGRFYGFIVTVCSESKAEKCPIFPGMPKKHHWDLDDPSSFEGTHEEKLAQTRVVRDQIKELVKTFIEETKDI